MFRWLRSLVAPEPLRLRGLPEVRQPLPPPVELPVATLFGVDYGIASDIEELTGHLLAGKKVVYEFKINDEMGALKQVRDFMLQHFGEGSLESRAVTKYPQLCSRCGAVFPGMLRGNTCPKCESTTGFLVLDLLRPEDVNDDDLAVLKEYWRHSVIEWWHVKGYDKGACQQCKKCNHQPIEKGGGYLRGNRLSCEPCIDYILIQAFDGLKKDPYYFGNDLWLGRMFAGGAGHDNHSE